mgnify:CR=1 FL=1
MLENLLVRQQKLKQKKTNLIYKDSCSILEWEFLYIIFKFVKNINGDIIGEEKFNKKNIASSLDGGTYKISYDNVELYFNDDGSCYYKNNHTEENYNTILSNEFVNYVKNLSD